MIRKEFLMPKIKLQGRVFIKGGIRVVTGLHIGGGSAGVQIGQIDNIVVRDPLTMMPYIPGSSIKGKMRSLSEKLAGLDQNTPIGGVRIHTAQNYEQCKNCHVCHIFGVPAQEEQSSSREKQFSAPTRLIVRDSLLEPDSLEGAKTDYLFTEIKWEVAIDRITSAAVPRQMERVPAGALFKDFEMVYTLYELEDEAADADAKRLKKVFEAMQLIEDDYLGGLGSRGSGKIQFENLIISCRPGTSYGAKAEPDVYNGSEMSLSQLLEEQDNIVNWVKKEIGLTASDT